MPALKAIALAVVDDPQHCAIAYNLGMDMLLHGELTESLGEFAQAFATSACNNDDRPVAGLEPKPVRRAAPNIGEPTPPSDRTFVALQFLDGCWRRYDVDWGFELCWRREDGRWLGDVKVVGPMAKPQWLGLVIARDSNGWMLSAGSPGMAEFAGLDRVPLLELTEGRVSFGVGRAALEFARQGDGLTLTRGLTYGLKKGRLVAPGVKRW